MSDVAIDQHAAIRAAKDRIVAAVVANVMMVDPSFETRNALDDEVNLAVDAYVELVSG